jgi:phospholipid N-methyltransferase
MTTEQDKIKKRYKQRQNDKSVKRHSESTTFIKFCLSEREAQYKSVIEKIEKNITALKIIEIGAGEGGNIPFFLELGIPLENIHVNELIPERVEVLKKEFPGIKIFEGDVLEIPNTDNSQYDLVFQSTVFTSVLDDKLKRKIANKMSDLLSEKGIILWYDFVYDNPKNKDVKGVPKKEVQRLFPNFNMIHQKKVTLAPPIGRRVKSLYPLFNIPPLRTHLVAGLKKK